MAKEKWNTIHDFPSYSISDHGRVKNNMTERILKDYDDGNGYRCIGLQRDGKQHTAKVHRLVAEAFIPKKDGLYEVNHIDGCKSHNEYSNLEWVNRSDNMFHAQKNGLWDVRRRIRVIETGIVYDSETECAKAIGGDVGHIYHCASGIRKTHLGYHYEYVDDNEETRYE